jgi:hypothetical protein
MPLLIMTDAPRTTINAEAITTIRGAVDRSSSNAKRCSVVANVAGRDIEVQAGLTAEEADSFVEELTAELGRAKFGVVKASDIRARIESSQEDRTPGAV